MLMWSRRMDNSDLLVLLDSPQLLKDKARLPALQGSENSSG